MPSPNSTFTEIVTTTLRNHPNVISDNVSANNAFYTRLKYKKMIKAESGGYEIVRPLDYAENSTYQRYSGFDTLDIAASDVLTAAKFDWMQAAVNVVASGRELRMNSGKERIINLVKARLQNALRTAANNFSIDLYSNGALSNQVGGLAYCIQNAGTGNVGGIDSSTYTFWQNKFYEAPGTNTVTKSNIKGYMNYLWLQLVRGTDKPDLLLSTHDFFAMYEEALQDLQRYTNDSTKEAGFGFQSLKYKSADVMFDSNSNFSTTGEKMYFLNTDFIELVEHTDARWTIMDEKVSTNQDGVVIPILWMGNVVVSNRALQGVLIDAA